MRTRVKGFILLNTMVILMVVGILLGTLTYFFNAQRMWTNYFYKEEQNLILKNCIKKNQIGIKNTILIKNSFNQSFTIP